MIELKFWPNAIVKEYDGTILKVMSPHAFYDMSGALRYIGDWLNGGYGYKVIASWIEVFKNGCLFDIVEHNTYVPCCFEERKE